MDRKMRRSRGDWCTPGSADEKSRSKRRAVLAILVTQAASRKSSDTAFSRISLPGKPLRAVPKTDAPLSPSTLPKYAQSWHQFWTGSAAHVHWRRSSERNREMASTAADYIEVLIGGGSGGEVLQRRGVHALVHRILRTRHEWLGITTTTHEKRVRIVWMTLLREYWSRQQLARHHCGHFRTIRCVIVMAPGTLGKNNIGGFERQSLQQPPRQLANADSYRGETCRSSRTAGTGRQGCNVQGWH